MAKASLPNFSSCRKICSLPNCNRKHKGRGYCEKHLYRVNLYGDPYTVKLNRDDPVARFWPEPFGLHSCDTPSCVRPSHIRAGTAIENSADMVARGRARCPRGERCRQAKLTVADVKIIKRRLSEGALMTDLAREFGVSDSNIRLIKIGRNWRHV